MLPEQELELVCKECRSNVSLNGVHAACAQSSVNKGKQGARVACAERQVEAPAAGQRPGVHECFRGAGYEQRRNPCWRKRRSPGLNEVHRQLLAIERFIDPVVSQLLLL